MNILVVAPHPDDLEFGCAGTISKFKEQGAEVDVIITVRPCEEIHDNRSQLIVQQELRDSMDLLDLHYQLFHTPLSDNDRPLLSCTPDSITQLESMIDKEYDLVITTDPGDFHQDHVTTFNMVNSICRKNVKELWTMEVSPYSNRNLTFIPNVFVDISNQFPLKLEAISCYNSYIDNSHMTGIIGLNSHRATQIKGASQVEAFNQIFRNI